MRLQAFHLSTQGASHIKRNKECQDAADSYVDENCAVAIVCDGHGGCDYVRSASGAKFACDVAKECILSFIKDADKAELSRYPARMLNNLEASIISKWRDTVYDHFRNNFFSDSELDVLSERAKNKYLIEKRIESAYGTTLIAVACTKDYWFGIHIGDGKCVAVNPAGKFVQPIPWDDKCFLNATTSLCDSDALNHFRYFYSEKCPVAVFVGSDGVDDCFQTDKQLHSLYRTVMYSFATTGFDKAVTDLSEYLPRLSAKGSGDDVSVAAVLDMDLIGEIEAVKEFDKEKEKKRREENERIAAQKAEEERRRVEEEYRRKEEERRRAEEERRRAEEERRLAAERRQVEIEKKRVDEERQRVERDKKLLEEQIRQMERDKRLAEEQRRRGEEMQTAQYTTLRPPVYPYQYFCPHCRTQLFYGEPTCRICGLPISWISNPVQSGPPKTNWTQTVDGNTYTENTGTAASTSVAKSDVTAPMTGIPVERSEERTPKAVEPAQKDVYAVKAAEATVAGTEEHTSKAKEPAQKDVYAVKAAEATVAGTEEHTSKAKEPAPKDTSTIEAAEAPVANTEEHTSEAAEPAPKNTSTIEAAEAPVANTEEHTSEAAEPAPKDTSTIEVAEAPVANTEEHTSEAAEPAPKGISSTEAAEALAAGTEEPSPEASKPNPEGDVSTLDAVPPVSEAVDSVTTPGAAVPGDGTQLRDRYIG